MKCRGCGAGMKTESYGIGATIHSCYVQCPACGAIHRIKCRHKKGKSNRRTIKLVSPNQLGRHKILFRAEAI